MQNISISRQKKYPCLSNQAFFAIIGAGNQQPIGKIPAMSNARIHIQTLAIQTLLATLGLATTLSLQAAPNGHYRWTDESGTVQYADRPPEGVEAEFIKFSSPKGSKPSDNETPSETTAEPKVYDEMEALPEKDPALCKQAQQNLKALEGARIRITEPDGSKRFLTEDEKETQRENARKFIKIHCD
jgi:hypothetical protein